MEKEKKKLTRLLGLSLSDKIIILFLNIFLFLLLFRSEKFVWIFMIGVVSIIFIYKYPQFLPAITFQIFGVYFFYLEYLNFSSSKKCILLFGFIFICLFFIKGIKNNIFKLIKDPIIILIALFTYLWIISLSISLSPRYGEQKVILHLLLNLPLFLQFAIFKWKAEDYNNIFKFVIILTCAFSINSIIHIRQFGLPKGTNLNYFDLNTIWASRIYGIGVLACVFFWFSNNKLIKRTNIVLSIIFFTMMILLGKRGPILSLIIAVISIIYLKQSNLKKTNYYLIGASMLLGLFVLQYWNQLIQIISHTGSTYDLSGFYRLQIFKLFGKVFESISFMGIGAGSFSKISLGQDIRWYPHNIFLETSLEAGLIAGLILFVLLLYVFIRILKYRKLYFENKQILYTTLVSFAILIFAILNAQFSGDLFANRYIWLGIGLIFNIRYLNGV